MKLPAPAALALTVLLGLAPLAQANVVYTYTGNTYAAVTNGSPNATYQASERVSGSITLADGNWANFGGTLAALAYDFFDGVTHYNAGNVNNASLFMMTDATGAPTRWAIQLLDLLPSGWNRLETDTMSSGQGDLGEHFEGFSCTVGCTSSGRNGVVGTWTVTHQPNPVTDPGPGTNPGTVPEPQSLALALLALLALPVAGSGRRRR
ncbi:MAG: hypothetical protein HY020_03125 [Burkholderiales bacterium]|nr:hypothetical protein [Burkholderiales bacterium]